MDNLEQLLEKYNVKMTPKYDSYGFMHIPEFKKEEYTLLEKKGNIYVVSNNFTLYFVEQYNEKDNIFKIKMSYRIPPHKMFD